MASTTRQALARNPQGARPRNKWWHDLEAEAKRMGYTWGHLVRQAQYQDTWRALVGGLYSSRGQRQWWWWWWFDLEEDPLGKAATKLTSSALETDVFTTRVCSFVCFSRDISSACVSGCGKSQWFVYRQRGLVSVKRSLKTVTAKRCGLMVFGMTVTLTRGHKITTKPIRIQCSTLLGLTGFIEIAVKKCVLFDHLLADAEQVIT